MSKQYCTNCGQAIEKGEQVCPHCKTSTVSEHNSYFKEFLIRHTKDELKSKTSDKIYEVLKNWLLSHLYGTVLSISIIAVIVSGAAVRRNKIPVVDERPEAIQAMLSSESLTAAPAETAEASETVPSDEEGMDFYNSNGRLSEEEAELLKKEIEKYREAVDSSYFDEETGDLLYVAGDTSEFFAADGGMHDSASVIQTVIQDANRHEGLVDNYEMGIFDYPIALESDLKSDAGKELDAQGRTVQEVIMKFGVQYISPIGEDEFVEDDFDPAWKFLDGPYYLRYVWVKDGDVWKIAEDRLISDP